MAKTPSILLPNVRDPQTEASWKSVKAVADHLTTALATSGTSNAVSLTALQAQITALQAAVAALQAAIAGLEPTYTCSVPIAKGQVVYEASAGHVAIADNSTLQTSQPVLGIATESGAAGQKITVATDGLTATGFVGLTPGPVYLGPAGTLLSANPHWPLYTTIVGYAVDSTAVLVLISSPARASSSFARTLMVMGA